VVLERVELVLFRVVLVGTLVVEVVVDGLLERVDDILLLGVGSSVLVLETVELVDGLLEVVVVKVVVGTVLVD